MGPVIDKDGFDRQIEITYEKLEGLLQRMSSSGEEASIANEALEELSTTLEELHVASEELSRQNMELAKAQLAAQAERQRYQDLFDFAPDGYLVTDTNGVIREANKAAADLLHVAQDRLVGKPLAVYVTEAERKAFRDILSTLLKRAITGANEWEIGLRPRVGRELRASITVTPVVPFTTIQQPAGKETSEGVGLRWSLRDITESKRAEERERLLEESQRATQEALQAKEALQVSEERYRALVESSPDLITRFDREMRMVYANPATLLRTGRPVEALMGRTAQEYGAAQASASIWEQNFQQVLETGKTQRFDNTSIWQGQERTYDSIAVPELAADGSVAMVMVIARDITEKRQAEEHLAFQANILANIADVVYATDGQMQVTYWNTAAEQLYGWKANEVLGKNVIEVVDSHFDRDKRAKLSQEITEKGAVVAEVEHRTKSGQVVFFDSKTILLRDNTGEMTGFLSVNHDITERKRANEALRESQRSLEAVFNSVTETIMMVDIEGKILGANETAAQRWGMPVSELIGINSFGLTSPDTQKKRAEQIQEMVSSGQPVRFQDERGGTVYDLTFYPIRDSAGKINSFVVFSRDISERIKAEQALQDSELKYRSLVKFAPAGIYEVDFRTGRFTEVNDAMCQILGYTREELLGMTAFNILDEAGQAAFANRVRQAQAGDALTPAAEYRVRAKDGRVIWGLLNVNFHREGGKIVRATVIANDISERRQAEQAQQESEARFRSVLDNSRDVIYRLNLQTSKYVYISPSAEKVMGFSAEELMAQDVKTALTLIHPEDLPGVLAAHARLEQSGESDVEYRQLTKSGEYRWLSNHMALTRDSAGQPLYRSGNLSDITERKQAEEALRESQTLLNEVMENTSDPVYVKDRQSHILMCNPALEHVAGKPAAEIIGKTDSEYYGDPAGGQVLHENDLRVIESGHSQSIEETVKTPEGYRVFLSSKAPYRDKSGDIIGIIGISHDITELKRAEEKLRASNDELRRFNKAMVGRELRMVELKNEINELCMRAGLPERYGKETGPLKNDNGPKTIDDGEIT